MLTIKQRLVILEQRGANEIVKPIEVEIVGPEGRTPEQQAAAALALKNGVKLVSIVYRDGRVPRDDFERHKDEGRRLEEHHYGET
jgi:hypothetical protein